MNEEKQKKIRTHLINFMNKELQNNKKNKKSNFMINSLTLEQLEKKNMQCKDFYIEEKDQIFHNIDNGWIIGLNIYINNTFNNNPFIYSLSHLIKDDEIINDIKNKNGININQTNNINNNKETIIQKQSNKILYIQKEGNVGSPVDTSLLIKKELGDRKLKKTLYEYNSNKYPINRSDLFLDKNDNTNENEEKNEFISNNNINITNDIDNNIKISNQLSNETLETEISRIIQVCHDDKYTNSFEHFPSDSKISELSKEIKIAKIYAKKLKSYCRTLKRKNPLNNDKSVLDKQRSKISKNNYDNYNSIQIYENKNQNQINKENLIKKVERNEEKCNKIKKYKKISTINLKKNLEKNKEDNNQLINIKHIRPIKKIKSQKNIKLRIKRNSFLKILKEIENEKRNNITSSSNNNKNTTLEEKTNKKRPSLFKLSKKKRKKTLEPEIKSKPKLKIKKELIKLPKKIIKHKRNKNLYKNSKTIEETYLITDTSIINQDKKRKTKEKINELIKNKILTEENIENNPKKLTKKKNRDDSNKKRKSSNINSSKNKNEKRGSLDNQINLSGFEKLNFLKIKTKSTQEYFLFNNNKKKIRNAIKLNNKTTTNVNTSHQRDSSPSIEKEKKHNKKNNNKVKNISNSRLKFKDKKKKTVGFLKTKQASAVLEAIRKMKKRKSTNYNDVKALGGKKLLSQIVNEDEKVNNNEVNKKINSRKIKFSKDFKEFSSNEIVNDKRENDIFNMIDEFLYKKKHERGKKCNLLIG